MTFLRSLAASGSSASISLSFEMSNLSLPISPRSLPASLKSAAPVCPLSRRLRVGWPSPRRWRSRASSASSLRLRSSSSRMRASGSICGAASRSGVGCGFALARCSARLRRMYSRWYLVLASPLSVTFASWSPGLTPGLTRGSNAGQHAVSACIAKNRNRALVGIREQPVAITKLDPRKDQIEALAKISDTLAKSNRAHVVMACATGKTFVALWASEELKPKTVLVLLPSLTLLQQTLDKWSRHNNWGKDFTYLCVCSDPTVTKPDENDPVRLVATEVEFRVDTDPDEVRRFIERDAPGVKVVFCTYQSSRVVSQGVRGLAPFDVAIFDEAHKSLMRLIRRLDRKAACSPTA